MAIRNRLSEIKILKSWIVFLMDVAICLVVTLVSVAVASVLFSGEIQEYLMLKFFAYSLFSSFVSVYLCKTYRVVIRHFAFKDVKLLLLVSFVKVFLLFCICFLRNGFSSVLPDIYYGSFLLDLLLTVVALIFTRLFMIFVYDGIKRYVTSERSGDDVLIYGIGEKSAGLINYFIDSKLYNIKGFLAYDIKKTSLSIGDFRVYGFTDKLELERIFNKVGAKYVLFPTYKDLDRETDRLVKMAQDSGIKMLISPKIDQVHPNNGVLKLGIREIKIEDLLGRAPIELDLTKVREEFQGKTVLVTGAAGSIGSELCRQLAKLSVRRLIMFDSAESPLHDHRLEMEEKYGKEVDLFPIIGDVRVKRRLDFVFKKFQPDVVFHAAAYKHVPLMEENPCEAVYVNVVGTRNVADVAVKYGVKRFVMVSTDKAVNPTNVMGATKRTAELYVQSLGKAIKEGVVEGQTKFITTRFGNVLGSNGSVIPRFRQQIEKGGPLTVTDERVTRFFMSIPEACRLVLEAGTMGNGCDIFIFDMGNSVKIIDLATRMIELAGYVPNKEIKIKFTGLRPGEKLYEELLNDKEATLPTENKKIRIAQTREADYAEINASVSRFESLVREVDVLETVKELKSLIPEFKSQNSRFEELDK